MSFSNRLMITFLYSSSCFISQSITSLSSFFSFSFSFTKHFARLSFAKFPTPDFNVFPLPSPLLPIPIHCSLLVLLCYRPFPLLDLQLVSLSKVLTINFSLFFSLVFLVSIFIFTVSSRSFDVCPFLCNHPSRTSTFNFHNFSAALNHISFAQLLLPPTSFFFPFSLFQYFASHFSYHIHPS